MAMKLSNSHKIQIKNMCDDGKNDQEIINFFNHSYKISLSNGDISVIRELNSKQKKIIRRWLKKNLAEPTIIKKFNNIHKILISHKNFDESKYKRYVKKPQSQKSEEAYKKISEGYLGQEYRKAELERLNNSEFRKKLKAVFNIKKSNPERISAEQAFCKNWQLMCMPYKVNGKYRLNLIKPYQFGTIENIDVIIENDSAPVKTVHKPGQVVSTLWVNNAAYEITNRAKALREINKISLAYSHEIHPIKVKQGRTSNIEKMVIKYKDRIKAGVPKEAALEQIIKLELGKNKGKKKEEKKKALENKFLKILKERELY